jgi:hypothetical protein
MREKEERMRRRSRRICLASAVVVAVAVCVPNAVAGTPAADEPETVMITLRAKAGAEDELARVIARHWETVRRLKAVREDAPHLTLRATDAGNRPYFVEILTWRDASIPDAAPPEVQAIWKEMNALVEKRGASPGLEIVEVIPVK